MLLNIQFVWTAPNMAHDGCASFGFPAPFFRGCYGTISLYWPAMTVAKGTLLMDAIAWLIAATSYALYLRVGWRTKAGGDNK